MAVIKYDPKDHELVDLPILSQIRKEVREPNLVVFRHRGHETWVLAFRQGNMMKEIVFLNDQEPTNRDVSVLRYREIVRTLTNPREVKATKKAFRDQARDGMAALEEESATYRRGKQGVYDWLKKNRSPVVAERYAHEAGFRGDSTTRVGT